jgi:Phage major capsid protein E
MPRFISPYDLDEIFGVLVDRDIPTPTELQSNFGQVVTFETETIDLDKIAPDLRIAIFVDPQATAKTTTGRGYQTKVFYPAYWKDKATVDFRNIRKRRLGAPLNTPTSTEGKIASALQDMMDIMSAKRTRLVEWMASQIMLYGSYTATSELHPPVLVDLEPNIATNLTTEGTSTATVPAAQAVSLSGGRANRANISGTNVTNPTTGQVIPTLGVSRNWGGASGTPVKDLEAMLSAAWEPISAIYMSDDAFNQLVNDPLFDSIVTPFLKAPASFTLDLVPKQFTKEGLKLRGSISNGGIPIWTYSAAYQPTNVVTTVPFIGSGWVVMMPQSSYGVQAYGAIQHGLADFRATELFWNSWVEEEFGQPWLQGQSAPLFLHTKINSTVAWKVM